MRKGADVHALKEKMLSILNARGTQYPAEHNVGHIYHASPAMRAFYQQFDPTNNLNPGIGKTTKARNWGDEKQTAPASQEQPLSEGRAAPRRDSTLPGLKMGSLRRTLKEKANQPRLSK